MKLGIFHFAQNRNFSLCVDNQTAIEKDLPIGSGEVESGHRSVIQKRMKLPGAWWDEKIAEDMIAMRTVRAHGDWSNYWNARRSTEMRAN